MASRLNASVLLSARQARGLTQVELAARAGVSQAWLSKAEADLADVTPDRIERLATALGFPSELLTRPGDPTSMSSSCIFHRKRQALPVAKARRVHALLELYRIQVEALSDGVPLPDLRVPREAPTADGWVSPSDIAKTTREVLGVGEGPVDNLVSLLEEAGVFVVRTDLGSRHIDAVTGWPKGRRPLVLLNVNAPTDRQRYTLAHELGHAVMHAESVDPVEAEADEFAAELLAPAAAIRPELDENLNLARLAELRIRWKLSMPALVRRAWDLGLLSSRQYKDLNIDLSRAGYRTREPAPLPAERPRLPGRLVTELHDRGLSDDAIAARALLDVDEFRHLYLGDPEEAA